MLAHWLSKLRLSGGRAGGRAGVASRMAASVVQCGWALAVTMRLPRLGTTPFNVLVQLHHCASLCSTCLPSHPCSYKSKVEQFEWSDPFNPKLLVANLGTYKAALSNSYLHVSWQWERIDCRGWPLCWGTAVVPCICGGYQCAVAMVSA